MKFNTPYMKEKPIPICIDCSDDETLVEQSHKDKCDITNIISRFQETGVLQHVNNHHGEYGFATAMDFQNAMELVVKAENNFKSLPAKIRNRFNNDPSLYLDFVQNPDNIEEMYSLGMAKRPPEDVKDDKQQGDIPPKEKTPDKLSD